MENKKLSSILEMEDGRELDFSAKTFQNDKITAEFLNCYYFTNVKLINIFFEESEFLGVSFTSCLFENCTFVDCIIRKSDITDSKFLNCKFLNCYFSPRVQFVNTLFIDSQFSMVNFSSSFLSECEFLNVDFITINFTGTSIVELKGKNIVYQDLIFNKDEPMLLYRSKNDFYLDEQNPLKITNSLNFQQEVEKNI